MSEECKTVHYKSGYKYQTQKDYCWKVDIKPPKAIVTDWIILKTDGQITIKKGYAWDGPSGPAIDTKNFMRGSLTHDALYQLIRYKHLPAEKRLDADIQLWKDCLADGMWRIRAWWVYRGVRLGGGPATFKPKKVYVAP